MSKRNIGMEILEGIREVKAHKKGRPYLKTKVIKEPSPARVIRSRLALSQTSFAGLMGVSVRTLQDWEQGRRIPTGPAKSLLRIVEQHPEIFVDLE